MLWSVYHCMHGTYFLLIYFVSQCIVPSHTLAVDASSSYVCTNEWLLTASTLCPLSLFCKKGESGKSQLRSKQSSNGPYPENFMTIGGCYTYRIMLPAWMKKEEQIKKERNEKMNNSDFWPSQVCHFKVHIANTTADWGKLCKRLCVLLDMSICSPAMILLCKC